MRVSNFLLWQIAYAEIWVTDTLWPDFRMPPSARGDRRLPEARSPLRRDQATGGGGTLTLKAEGKRQKVGGRSLTRVLSALVLLPVVIGTIWFLPASATLLLALIAARPCVHRIRGRSRKALGAAACRV